MEINVNKLLTAIHLIDNLNSLKLEEIVFVKDGIAIDVPKEKIEEWKIIGLNNKDFLIQHFSDN